MGNVVVPQVGISTKITLLYWGWHQNPPVHGRRLPRRLMQAVAILPQTNVEPLERLSLDTSGCTGKSSLFPDQTLGAA